MGMKKCKECGEDISQDVKSCPKCGKDPRNFFKKHPILCVVGIIIIVIIIGTSSGDSSEKPKNTLNNPETNNTENIEKAEYNVGEIYEDSNIAIKYVSKNENFTKIQQYADIKSGYKIIQATFEFENVGETNQYVSSAEFNCYADGYSCEDFLWVDDSSFYATLSSGKKTKGSVYFEVPKDAEKITIEYENNLWTSEKIVFVVK